MKKSKLTTTLTLIGLFCVNLIYAQTTVSGSVIDSDSNEPIPGVNIIVQGTTDGTNSDFDGNFSFSTTQSLPFTVEVSSIGFGSKSIQVTSADQVLTIALDPGENLDEIIVSASRRPQKIQDAPASVSVISAKDIENSAVAVDPVRLLMNVPGVQIQQQSANTINIEMRSGAGIFGSATFPMLDYRFLSTPAAGTFFTQQSGLSNIDLAKIEVVRGAASALYGPNVVSGVVHFMSKNPIDYPGTTVELIGGTMKTMGAAFRHAYASDDKKFGYKINGKYSEGDDFELDGTEIKPSTGENYIQTLATTIYQPKVAPGGYLDATGNDGIVRSMSKLDDNNDGNPLATKYKNISVNAHLEFRPSEKTNAFLSGGYAKGGALFFNAQGAGYQNGQDYWAQARVQSGGLFAQVFYNYNDGGDKNNPTFLYNSGFRQIAQRNSLDAQVQYNFDVPAFLDTNFTVGLDHRNIQGNSDNTLYGRNDSDDDYIITGVYGQGTSKLSEKLDLTYAVRYDTFNLLDEDGISPRIALVYKANDKNTFRVTYNSSTAASTALQNFIDFPVNTIIPGSYDVWLSGEVNPQTFAPGAPIALPAFGGATIPQGSTTVPNAYLYGALLSNPATIAGASAQYAANPLLAGLRGLEGSLNPTLGAIGSPALDFESILLAAMGATSLSATGNFGTLTPYNLQDQTPMSGTPIGAGSSKLATINSFEVGYNGIIGDKLKVMVDFYTYEVKGFTQFTAIGPTFRLGDFDPTDASAFAGNVGAQIGANSLAAVTSSLTTAYEALAVANGFPANALYGGNAALGLPPLAGTITNVAAGLGQLATGVLNEGAGGVGSVSGGFIGAAGGLFPFFGTIESESVPQGDGVTHIPFGYRKFENAVRSHYGIDVGFEYFLNDNFTLWANGSYLSQTEWTPGESDDDGLPFATKLNTPQFKYRAGIMWNKDYRYGSISFQHDDAFESNQGDFAGTADEKNLIDANYGIYLTDKLKFDITASNLFDQKYRAFPNMPVIGRRIIGKLTFDL